MGLAPKWHFVSQLPSGSPKIPKVGTPATFETHNFVCKHEIEVRFEQSYSPHQKLSNGMLHVIALDLVIVYCYNGLGNITLFSIYNGLVN
jgi:hypothetical protein